MKNIGIVISSFYRLIYCFFSLSFPLQAFGAYPTVEGLFRNGDNSDLVGDYIVIKMAIEEVQNEEILRQIKVADGDEIVANILGQDKKKPLFVKLIYSIEGEARADLLRLEYSDLKMKKNSLERAALIKGLRRQIRKDENYERAFFNSILLMFFINESKDAMAVLHNMGINLPTNPMMMNAEKMELIGEYKKYLLAIKEDTSLQEELLSPLKPVEEEEKNRVDELMKSNMYKRSENISLVKEKNSFFWKLKQGDFEAYFRNKKHRLDRLILAVDGKEFSINCGEYVLFNGVHELPTQILIKDTRSRVYKIKLLSFSNFVNSGKNLYERFRDYKKEEDKHASDKKEQENISVEASLFELLY